MERSEAQDGLETLMAIRYPLKGHTSRVAKPMWWYEMVTSIYIHGFQLQMFNHPLNHWASSSCHEPTRLLVPWSQGSQAAAKTLIPPTLLTLKPCQSWQLPQVKSCSKETKLWASSATSKMYQYLKELLSCKGWVTQKHKDISISIYIYKDQSCIYIYIYLYR